MDLRFLLLGLIVMLAFTTLAMTGFGSIVISLALGAQLYPIQELPPMLVPLDLILCGSVAIRNLSGVDWPLFGRKILPAMLVGVGAGMAVARLAPGEALRIAFGVVIVLLSARELWTLLVKKLPSVRPISRPAFAFWMFASGTMTGIYASGGPPMVYALSRLEVSKARFRATLAILWFLMDAIMATTWLVEGRYAEGVSLRVALLLPIVPASVWLGEKLHHKVSERTFRIVIFALLLVAGSALVLR